jgi:hypothetical protein
MGKPEIVADSVDGENAFGRGLRVLESAAERIAAGGWWRRVGDSSEVVWAIQRNDIYVSIAARDSWLNVVEFLEQFEPISDEEGQEAKAREMQEAVAAVGAAAEQQRMLAQEAGEAAQAADAPMEASDSAGTSLSIFGGATAEEASLRIRMVRGRMKAAEIAARRAADEIQKKAEEQAEILRIRTEELEAQMARAKGALHLVGSYLGKEGEFIRLAEGPLSSEDDPVAVRQLILFMDEEVAAEPKKIKAVLEDAEDGEKQQGGEGSFDRWAKRVFRNLLPEPKCVVAVRRYRRQQDRRGDAHEVFLLVRNGESLWRVKTSLSLDDTLIPTSGEMEKLMALADNPSACRSDRDRAEETRRSYMAAVFLLQGLADRSRLFDPMSRKIRFFNFSEHNAEVRYIRDAEDVLRDGRPSWKEWLEDVNSRLEVGCRVVGQWSALADSRREFHRIYPRSADIPALDAVLTLDSSEKGFFKAHYKREHRWRSYKVRATVKLRSQDDFLLNVDETLVEDLEYYRDSRLHRRGYLEMLPVIHQALAFKRAEEERERPFIKLLEQKAADLIPGDQSLEAVAAAVRWWKTKAKQRRALVAKDSQAYREILAFLKRWRPAGSVEGEFAVVAGKIGLSDVLAAYKTSDGWTVVRRQGSSRVWVQKEHWTVRGKLKSSKPWSTLLASEKARPDLAYRSPEWVKMRWGVPMIGLHSGPSREVLADLFARRCENIRKRKDESIPWGIPLAVDCDVDGGDITFYMAKSKAVIPPHDRRLTGAKSYPVLVSVDLWMAQRDATSSKTLEDYEKAISEGRYSVKEHSYYKGFGWTERESWNRFLTWKGPDRVVVREWSENVQLFEEEFQKARQCFKRAEESHPQAKRILRKATRVMEDLDVAKARKDFDKEYVDPDGSIWEEHAVKVRKKLRNHNVFWVNRALDHAVESGTDVTGMTFAELASFAESRGLGSDDSDWKQQLQKQLKELGPCLLLTPGDEDPEDDEEEEETQDSGDNEAEEDVDDSDASSEGLGKYTMTFVHDSEED